MSGISPWLVLALAVGVMPAASGRFARPAAAWVAPAALLGFVLAVRPVIGIPAAVWVYVLAIGIGWRGLVPLPRVGFAAFVLGVSLVSVIPYAVARLAGPHLHVLAASLLFPACVVVLEALGSRTSPFGAWGALAHTQIRVRPLAQLLAVSPAAVAFLVAWTSSVVAVTVERGVDPLTVGLVAVALVAALVAGLARMRRPAGRPVRAAAIVEPADGPVWDVVVSPLLHVGSIAEGQWEALVADGSALVDGMFEQTAHAAGEGAELVVWAEGAAVVPASSEPSLRDRLCAEAERLGIWIVAGAFLAEQDPPSLENVAFVAGPEGAILGRYTKRHPVPGPERRRSRPGDSTVRTVDTPFGRLAVLVCFDADHRGRWRDVARAGADVVAVPSSDWPAIDPLHAEMALAGAVEAGVAVIRPARSGRSMIADARCSVAAERTDDPSSSRRLVAEVDPTGRATWLRARVGRRPMRGQIAPAPVGELG